MTGREIKAPERTSKRCEVSWLGENHDSVVWCYSMETYRILFDQIEWHSPQPGVRFKVARDGSKQVRLIEFTAEFVEDQWCEKGHVGFVLSGELEIDFSGHVVQFPEGTALLIPAGPRHAHKARVLTPLVRLFLVEEVSE